MNSNAKVKETISIPTVDLADFFHSRGQYKLIRMKWIEGTCAIRNIVHVIHVFRASRSGAGDERLPLHIFTLEIGSPMVVDRCKRNSCDV